LTVLVWDVARTEVLVKMPWRRRWREDIVDGRGEGL